MTYIRFFAAAAEAAGVSSADCPASTRAELDAWLVQQYGDSFARVLAQCAVLSGGIRVEGDDALTPGVTVDVMPPFAGG